MQKNNEKEIDKSIGEKILERIERLEKKIAELKDTIVVKDKDGVYEYCMQIIEREGYISANILKMDPNFTGRYSNPTNFHHLFYRLKSKYNLSELRSGKGNAIYLCKPESERELRSQLKSRSFKKPTSSETMRFLNNCLQEMSYPEPLDFKSVLSNIFKFKTEKEIEAISKYFGNVLNANNYMWLNNDGTLYFAKKGTPGAEKIEAKKDGLIEKLKAEKEAERESFEGGTRKFIEEGIKDLKGAKKFDDLKDKEHILSQIYVSDPNTISGWLKRYYKISIPVEVLDELVESGDFSKVLGYFK